ncbi:MAG: HAMP domain-containing histidine kinase [Bacteroidetes bacterium]|nr:HAMP domain-containing histidine kinase [Bacteroidota bacterium]
MLKSKRVVFVFIASAILLFISSCMFFTFQKTQNEIILHSERLLQQKFEKNKQSISFLSEQHFKINSSFSEKQSEEDAFFVLENDSLKAWTNSVFASEYELKNINDSIGVIKLKQGYYLYLLSKKQDIKIITLTLIKSNYSVQNNFLKNTFAGWLNLPPDAEISFKKKVNNAIFLNKHYLFDINLVEPVFISTENINLIEFVFVIAFVLLYLGLFIVYNQNNNRLILILLIGFIALLRVYLQFFVPDLVKKNIFYDIRIFANASSFFNRYLADVLLNFIVLFIFSFTLYLTRFKDALKQKVLYYSATVVLCSALIIQINDSFQSLVKNSTLSFNLLSVFTISSGSIFALIAITIGFCSMYLLFYKLLANSYFKTMSTLKKALYTIPTFILMMLCSVNRNYSWFNFWPIGALLIMLALLVWVKSNKILLFGILALYASVVTSYIINYYIAQKQKNYYEVQSFNLSQQQDLVLENEFASVSEKLNSDNQLNALIGLLPYSSKEISEFLKQKYFTGYFNRYNIEFNIFDEQCHSMLNPSNVLFLNEGYFEDQIKFYSDSSFVNNLFFNSKEKLQPRYLARMELGKHRFYAVFEAKEYEEIGNFPELLLDQSQQKQSRLKGLNYAVYRQNQNTARYGKINYPLILPDSAVLNANDINYTHYFFTPDAQTRIIISASKTSFAYLFNYNSYVFLFFSAFFFVFYVIYTLVFTNQFKTASLSRRIQFIIILMLLLLLLGVGFTSGKMLINQFNNDNQNELKEKTLTILNELQAQFKNRESFSENEKEIVKIKIKELAHLFNTDINLYDKQGKLFVTSQPKLFELGLMAQQINPEVFAKLKNEFSSGDCLSEKAGKLNYLSYYMPMFENNRNISGIINLPYFAKQSDLIDELSKIISALINLYVFLLLLSVLAAIFISGYVTKPLQLIKKQIANIQLGKLNEKINWKSNDEIGKLVSEYNLMLVKLEESAQLLAMSERESAWREMAKQVAHEIKNPLTPMKLNLQYLQHLLNANPNDFKDRFSEASKGIIEQIDTLANIATEFANFAKLNQTEMEAVDICEQIKTAVATFGTEIKIKVNSQLMVGSLYVKASKDQCLRVFNNVIKNALQAIENTNEPFIEINVQIKEKSIIISVSDNGDGIPKSIREKMFIPNFTTKSTGSGLGLAMVKSMMKSFGGNVWFESEEGKGAIFYLEFLKAITTA